MAQRRDALDPWRLLAPVMFLQIVSELHRRGVAHWHKSPALSKGASYHKGLLISLDSEGSLFTQNNVKDWYPWEGCGLAFGPIMYYFTFVTAAGSALPGEVIESSGSSWPGWVVYSGRSIVAPQLEASLAGSERRLTTYTRGQTCSIHRGVHRCSPALFMCALYRTGCRCVVTDASGLTFSFE